VVRSILADSCVVRSVHIVALRSRKASKLVPKRILSIIAHVSIDDHNCICTQDDTATRRDQTFSLSAVFLYSFASQIKLPTESDSSNSKQLPVNAGFPPNTQKEGKGVRNRC
jgi:hypothetical protein